MSFSLRCSALFDVAIHYGRTIAHHWRDRHEAAPARSYTAAEAEFLPASLELIERPVSPTIRLTGALLCALVVLTLLWSLFARVDIVVTGVGKVIPSSRTKSIASVEVASVRAIHVVEGQEVEAGDVLVELDAGVFEADERKAEADIDAARLEMARSAALIMAIDLNRTPVLGPVPGISTDRFEYARLHLVGQYVDYSAKRKQIEAEIARYSRALPLAQQRARQYERLAETHDVSTNAWSEKLQAAIDLEGQLEQARNARLSLIAQTRREALDSLTEARRVVDSATQDAARASSYARLLTLRAPVAGSVQQLAVHTVGGVVPAAQQLMLIVPAEDPVEVEAYVDNKDIGFIHEGQIAEIKIDAFEYTKYGMVRGEVAALSKDAVEDESRGLLYKAKVRLEQTFIRVNGESRALAPGMTVSAEIKTGRRRVIEYVLSPLLRRGHESFDER